MNSQMNMNIGRYLAIATAGLLAGASAAFSRVADQPFVSAICVRVRAALVGGMLRVGRNR